jgi:hypothetical protein
MENKHIAKLKLNKGLEKNFPLNSSIYLISIISVIFPWIEDVLLADI